MPGIIIGHFEVLLKGSILFEIDFRSDTIFPLRVTNQGNNTLMKDYEKLRFHACSRVTPMYGHLYKYVISNPTPHYSPPPQLHHPHSSSFSPTAQHHDHATSMAATFNLLHGGLLGLWSPCYFFENLFLLPPLPIHINNFMISSHLRGKSFQDIRCLGGEREEGWVFIQVWFLIGSSKR